MNDYIIYTTEGYTCGPNSDVDVENCQVLGITDGSSKEDAVNRLFEQNDWIRKAGFSIENAVAYPLLTTSIQDDIRTVVEYLWKDEHRHFQENHYPKDHIFRVLKRLKETLI